MKVLKPNISFCFDLKRFFIHTFMLKGKSAIRGDSMWSLVSKEKDLFQLVLRASQCVNFLCSFETRNEESKSKTRLANVLIFQVVGFGSTQHFHSPEVQKCSKVFAPRRTVPCPTSFAEINEAFNNVYSAMHQLDFSISFFNCRLQCQVLASFNDSWIESKCSSPIVGLIDRNCFWRNDSLDVFIQLVTWTFQREVSVIVDMKILRLKVVKSQLNGTARTCTPTERRRIIHDLSRFPSRQRTFHHHNWSLLWQCGVKLLEVSENRVVTSNKLEPQT